MGKTIGFIGLGLTVAAYDRDGAKRIANEVPSDVGTAEAVGPRIESRHMVRSVR